MNSPEQNSGHGLSNDSSQQPGHEPVENDNGREEHSSKPDYNKDREIKITDKVRSFYKAIEKGDLDTVKQMIDEDGIDENFFVPKSKEARVALDRYGDDQALEDWYSIVGKYPLSVAQDPEMAKFLIDRGAEVNPSEGMSPAVNLSYAFIYQQSLRHYTQGNIREMEKHHDDSDSYFSEKKAELASIENEEKQIVATLKVLVENGARVAPEIMTVAIESKDMDFLKQLIQGGGKEVLEAETHFRVRPYLYNEVRVDDPLGRAVRLRNGEAVKMLVENGALLYDLHPYVGRNDTLVGGDPGVPRIYPREDLDSSDCSGKIRDYIKMQLVLQSEKQLIRYQQKYGEKYGEKIQIGSSELSF